MAAATPKTPSDAQPTSENITYEATLNAAASASRFPAGAFLDYAGLKKILEALAEMYATGDRPTEGLAYASLATTAAAPRGPTSFQVSSHEAFLEKLDGELAKCDDFAHREVVKVITFGAGAMAVADGAAGTAAERSRAWVVAVALSVGSIAINIFALYNYKWRLGRIRSREPVEWGDPRGPAVLGSILIALLSLSLVVNTRRLMAGEI